jgi:hypothetical protein
MRIYVHHAQPSEILYCSDNFFLTLFVRAACSYFLLSCRKRRIFLFQTVTAEN